MTRQALMENVYLNYIPSEKFKTGFLSAQLVMPLERESAALNALLVNVLSRGTVRCPDMAAISARLDALYGARLEPTVRKKGENQVFGFVASSIDERFLPEGERLLEPLTDLLGDMLCNPATKNGRLNGAYVDSERVNLADLIRSDINDKRLYAGRRLIEEMCAGEPYGISRLGEVRDVERISLQKLNSHYQTILPAARLELVLLRLRPGKAGGGAFPGLSRACPARDWWSLPPLSFAPRRSSAGWWRRPWMWPRANSASVSARTARMCPPPC